jgi:hypothetical protein
MPPFASPLQEKLPAEVAQLGRGVWITPRLDYMDSYGRRPSESLGVPTTYTSRGELRARHHSPAAGVGECLASARLLTRG